MYFIPHNLTPLTHVNFPRTMFLMNIVDLIVFEVSVSVASLTCIEKSFITKLEIGAGLRQLGCCLVRTLHSFSAGATIIELFIQMQLSSDISFPPDFARHIRLDACSS